MYMIVHGISPVDVNLKFFSHIIISYYLENTNLKMLIHSYSLPIIILNKLKSEQ